MKRHFVWISVGLALNGLWGFASISFAQDEKWTKKANMPIARVRFSTSAVNGKIYAIGGDGPVPSFSTVEEYDLGFADEEGQGVELQGKLVTEWGKIKANHENLKEHERARK